MAEALYTSAIIPSVTYMNKEISENIVELTLNDLDNCTAFWDIPSKLEEPIKSGEKKAFAYKTGNSVVGGCALSIEADCGHFSYFSVAPNFRGNGIGSCIMNFAEKYFKEMKVSKIRLHVDKDNSAAIRLYERNGFVYEREVTPERIAMIKMI